MRAIRGLPAVPALLLIGALARAQLPTPPYPDPPPYPPYPDPGPAPAVPEWPARGVPICTAAGRQEWTIAIDDHAHGAYFAWEDRRGSSADIYAIRVGADGSPVSGWTVNGSLVAGGAGDQLLVACLTDGPWGAYVIWREWIGGVWALLVQRLTSDGAVAPGWPASGLRVCESDSQDVPFVYSDRQGGLQIVWFSQQQRKATVQHLGPDGSSYPGWPECGIVAVSPSWYEDPCCGLAYNRAVVVAAPIWPDGALVGYRSEGWRNECHGNPDGSFSCVIHEYLGCDVEVIFQGPDTSKRVLYWPPPIQDCGSRPEFSPDEAGGILTRWPDSVGRSGVLGNPTWSRAVTWGQLFPAGDGSFFLRVNGRFVRLLGDGAVAPGWSLPSPTPPCDAPCLAYWGHTLAPDGTGGLFFAWSDYRYGEPFVHVGRLLSDGTRDPRLPSSGLLIGSAETSSYAPLLVSNRRGDVIVAWSEGPSGEADLYAYRLAAGVPVAATASWVSSVVSPGLVEIAWSVSTGPERLAVERRGLDEPWRWLADVVPDGRGQVRVADRAVEPGAMYRYRLTASGRILSEVEVAVPAALVLSFEGAQPNPTARGVSAAFTLPAERRVGLRLTDVAGRMIRVREMGLMPAGRHTVAMTASDELTPGTYFIEFRTDHERLVRRAVVIR